jgi:hypothetical protein
VIAGRFRFVERYSSGDTAQARVPQQQRRLLAGADTNKDGTISPDGLRAFAMRGAQQQFGQLDRNHNGRLTITEFASGGGLSSP